MFNQKVSQLNKRENHVCIPLNVEVTILIRKKYFNLNRSSIHINFIVGGIEAGNRGVRNSLVIQFLQFWNASHNIRCSRNIRKPPSGFIQHFCGTRPVFRLLVLS